jgi:GH24 family phage-related lysozyme (muramidase)
MFRPSRSTVAALSVSAAAFVALVGHEGYTDKAVIPVKGDVPTVGFGSTVREDGTRVEMGDTITPQKAVARSLAHIQKDERGIKSCITAPLSQAEYDLMVDFSYQYGTGALCRSSMASEANAGRYAQSCAAYLEYKKVAGYDCSTLINGVPNKRCWGVWTRSQGRYQTCMAAQ